MPANSADRSNEGEIRLRIEAAGLMDGFVIEDMGDRFVVRDQTSPPIKGRRRRALIREAVMGMGDVWVGVQLEADREAPAPPSGP
jgi:hypothetical protein